MENTNLSCEPMDIDLSSQSVKDMDISYNDYEQNVMPRERPSSRISSPLPMNLQVNHDINRDDDHRPAIKKYHIKISKSPRSYNNTLLKLIAAIVVIYISVVTYHIHSVKCCDQLDLKKLSVLLSNKLHGQSLAVEQIIKALEVKAMNKILYFSGGTGVGKSFTSSLLIESLGVCSNVYHYTMPTFENTFSTDLMLGLTMCGMSLFIVDDLTIKDINVNVQIQNVIKKSESLEKELVVILIYNCNEGSKDFDVKCDESFNNKLIEKFSNVNVLKRFIKFEPLTQQHLKECIRQELSGRQLNEQQFDDVLKNFNVSVDGCKGVHSKMKYLNIL